VTLQNEPVYEERHVTIGSPKPMKESPIKDEPLRVPGQSLQKKIDELVWEKAFFWIIISLVSMAVAGMEWFRWLFRLPPAPVPTSLIALLVVAISAWRIIRLLPAVRNMVMGRSGERHVGELLEELRAKGYRVFHDLVEGDYNIDHVAVGPTGLYAFETKTRSKPTHGHARVVFDGQSVTVDGQTPDRDPVEQARAAATRLAQIVAKSTGKTLPVRPVVLYPGWWVNAPSGVDVWVLNPKMLFSYLKHEKTVLPEEDVSLVAYHLERHIRAGERTQ
jgi:hypothetical protein